MSCGQLDIPYEQGQDPSIYSSTRGHKINHSFGNSNAHLSFYDSARFGIVSSITSRVGITIPKDVELLIHYGYSYSGGPRWYKRLFKDFLWDNEASEKIEQNKFKDCHFADGSDMDSTQCNNYLHKIKNNLIRSYGIAPESDMDDVKIISVLDNLLTKHQSYTSKSMKRT